MAKKQTASATENVEPVAASAAVQEMELTKPEPTLGSGTITPASGGIGLRLKILIAILIVVALGAATLFVFLGFKDTPAEPQITSPSQEELDAQKHAEIVADNWLIRGVDSSSEELQKYITELDAQLSDPSIPDKSKRLLMLRKAMTLGAVRDGSSKESILEGLSLLNSLYAMEPRDEEERGYKNAVIPLSLQLLKSSSYFVTLGEHLPGGFDVTYARYQSEEYPAKEAVMLAFRDFARLAPDEQFRNDKAVVTERAYLTALYLYAFGGEDREVDAIYLQQLQEDVSMYSTLETLLYEGSLKGNLRPAVAHAFAFDIAHTYNADSVSDEMNAGIDFLYEQAFVHAELESLIDDTTRAVVKIENAFNFLDSLHRRYASKPDAAKVDLIIEQLVTSVNLNETTKNEFRAYLVGGKTNAASWAPMRANFYEIAEQYPELQELVVMYSAEETAE